MKRRPLNTQTDNSELLPLHNDEAVNEEIKEEEITNEELVYNEELTSEFKYYSNEKELDDDSLDVLSYVLGLQTKAKALSDNPFKVVIKDSSIFIVEDDININLLEDDELVESYFSDLERELKDLLWEQWLA